MPVTVVVPYRNRGPQLAQLLPVLQSHPDIAHIHVCEDVGAGPFNRGWVKNVGFLQARELRPDSTVYFHDVDLLPGRLLYPDATPGGVVHLYGHPHCLGGIVGMRAADFDSVGGFAEDHVLWGGEDRRLRMACAGLAIEGPYCARFACDATVREMDPAGRPLPGRVARRLHR